MICAGKEIKSLLCYGSRLVELLASADSTKRRQVLEHMMLALQPILEKGIVDHSLTHRALAEFLAVAPKARALQAL